MGPRVKPKDDDGGRTPCGESNTPHATPKPRARETRRRLGAVSMSGTGPDSWGAGDRPVVVGRSGLARVTRAPPVRKTPRLPGAGRLFFKRNSTQAPGGFVTFGPSGTEHLPLPPGARQEDPSGAAGTCQAGVCGDAAFRDRAARPDRDADQTPPVEDRAARLPLARKARALHLPQPVPAIRAGKPSAGSTSIRQAPALAGVSLRKLPARRYGARAPKLTASRRPGLRQPRPSVRDGRWG